MKRSAIKTDLFSGDKRRAKLDVLGDPLVFLERHVDFVALRRTWAARAAPGE